MSVAIRMLLIIPVLCAVIVWAQESHSHDLTQQELGAVQFRTSCVQDVGASFTRAVALLHSFQYEQADRVFAAISTQDSQCAMSYWGIAMANYHGLWDTGDMNKGRAAVAKAREVAGANKQTTPREKAYIDAISEIYKQDGKDKTAHAQAFEQRMGALQTSYPDDSEAAVFHALTLAISAPKTDKSFANQRKCGEILEPLFRKLPHHPGVAHYLIHCYDNPVLAEKALPAARAYAQIAPASAHAQHMPSHIFTRLGLWNESIASNIRSAAVAVKAEETSTNGEARDQRLHAMDYLEYAYLQTGQVTQAKAVLDEMNSLAPVPGLTLPGNYASAAIPARYAVELGRWEDASRLGVDKTAAPWAQAITWLAIGVGSARTGNVERAAQAEQSLGKLRDTIAAQKDTYWSNQVEVQRREVAAWIANQSKKSDDAVRLMRSAVELEESMDKHPATPGAITPAREMLAQILMLQKRPKLALTEFETVLGNTPNRFNALYGAAIAADESGDSVTAVNFFQKLTETSTGNERPELTTARKKTAIAMK